MSEAPAITWFGKSGKKYNYHIHPIGTEFKEESGNYIFAKVTSTGSWSACYIGQTENLNQRLGNHEKEACAKKIGATHIHTHITTGGEVVRKAEEKDLIINYRPPCNELLI